MKLISIASIIVIVVALYSLKENYSASISCSISDYTCIFTNLIHLAIVILILYIASRFL